MSKNNPPHPGEFIREVYLEPFVLSARALAKCLDVAPSTLNRVITGKSGISPDMALRLSKSVGRTAESWLEMQAQYDLWQARQTSDLDQVQRIDFAT